MKKKMGFIEMKKMEAKKKAAKKKATSKKKAPKMTRMQALAKARKAQKK
tara:strand:+ start:553 stop:699 length:147 start_codon:yes stop_codon:yes gene_type:complete